MTPAGKKVREDSLDLIGIEDANLEHLFEEWDRNSPEPETANGEAVVKAWERGTIGKVVLRHAAVRVAAKTDVLFWLERLGRPEIAEAFGEHHDEARRVIDELDRRSRGRSALDLQYAEEFVESVEELRRIWRGEFRSETEYGLDRVADALGSGRSKLRTARFVRKHAPIHPARHTRWYDRLGPVVRLHALFDRLRGLPNPESATFYDKQLAERHDVDE